MNPMNPTIGSNPMDAMNTKPTTKVKIIKRYQNRKLYDTQQSCYVTLDDIAKMIRASEEVMVIDIDLKRCEEVRRIWPFLRDRRIDAYQDILKRYID